MFRQIAQQAPGGARSLLIEHPETLAERWEGSWSSAQAAPPLASGVRPPFPPTEVIRNLQFPQPGLAAVAPPRTPQVWQHLIYAYVIESTGVFEILCEVVRRAAQGESLGMSGQDVRRWLRATEELFFSEPPRYRVNSLRSDLRPDDRVNRANAYWRMFGLELPHQPAARWAPAPSLGSTPWKSDTDPGVNAAFVPKFEEFLRQVWIGIENDSNTSGPKPTDPSSIARLSKELADLMEMRRLFGMLFREEFTFVSTMSWFHLSVERDDSPLVQSLNAQGSDPAARLKLIAARVGMKPSERARDLFELADLVATLVRAIELGYFDKPQQAEALYIGAGAGGTALTQSVTQVITLWQAATGHLIKDPRVTVQGSPPLVGVARNGAWPAMQN